MLIQEIKNEVWELMHQKIEEDNSSEINKYKESKFELILVLWRERILE